MKKTVLVMTHTAIDHDSRIIRQVRQLSGRFNVLLCCRNTDPKALAVFSENVTVIVFASAGCSNKVGKRFIKILLRPDGTIRRGVAWLMQHIFCVDPTSAFGLYQAGLFVMSRQIQVHPKFREVDAIVANDVLVVPFAITLRSLLPKRFNKQVPIFGDMHEVHFDYGAGSKAMLRSRKWICKYLLRRCDQLSSVSEQISKLYEQFTDGRSVMTIRSAPDFHDLQPRPAEATIRMVHIGGAQKERGIKEHIDLLNLLDDKFTLDLYLVAVTDKMSEYLEEVRQHIIDSKLQDRVSIRPPVRSEDVITALNQYDIGIFYLKPMIANHKYVLPNKLFEYIQAKLAVVVTPIEAMESLVRQYDVGQTPADYELKSFAKSVEQVAGKLEHYKYNALAASKELHAEGEWEKLLTYLETRLN